MNYIVMDLEFNQGYDFTKENKNTTNSKCPFEIIQIGALKLDKNLQTISTLDRFVKPELYTALNPFVEEITGLAIEDLNNAKPFKEIYKEFVEFVKKENTEEDTVFCIWGMSDMKELFRNTEYHKLDISLIPNKYINLQKYASKYLNCAKGTNVGLGKTVELLKIPVNNQFHNAFNDAYYTTEIFKKINTEEIKPLIYNPHKPRKINNRKQKVDTTKLINQFEKMFNRAMTEEEKSIIKLAYIMGKTNQF